jgi:hypothetical protein
MYPAYNQNKEFIIQYLINAIEKSMRWYYDRCS